eukprot:g28221.t1
MPSRISTSPSALWTSGRRFAKCQRAGAQCIIGGFLCAIPLRKRCRSFAKGHLSESKPGNGNECFSPFPAGYDWPSSGLFGLVDSKEDLELYNSVVRFIGTHGTGQSWQMRQALMPSGQLKLKVIVEAGLGWHTIHWEGKEIESLHLEKGQAGHKQIFIFLHEDEGCGSEAKEVLQQFFNSCLAEYAKEPLATTDDAMVETQAEEVEKPKFWVQELVEAALREEEAEESETVQWSKLQKDEAEERGSRRLGT